MTAFSYQLYSSRNFEPLSDTFKMLGDLGYTAVEGYRGLFDQVQDLGALRDELDKNGLTMATCHMGFDWFLDMPERVLEIAQTLGMTNIYQPYLAPEERPTDAAGWTAVGKRASDAANILRHAGINFGWHNHDFEFEALPSGEIPMDLLLDADENLEFEFDLAWAVKTGFDPDISLKKYGSRVTALHVKDIAAEGECADEDGWADLGKGVITDWKSYFNTARDAGTRHFIIEHDNPSDHHRFASDSLAAVKSF